MKLTEMTVTDYLAELGSDAPAPGGGSASALMGAQGAGLIAMVAALTIGKKKYAGEETLCFAVKDEVLALKNDLIAQIDADTQAFNQVSAAFKLPKETDGEKTARTTAIQAATMLATQVPFETLKLAAEAVGQAKRLVGHSNTNTASDLGVAALNLLGCAKGAWLNVLINLGGLKDTAAVERYSTEGRGLIAKVQADCDWIYEEIEKSLLF